MWSEGLIALLNELKQLTVLIKKVTTPDDIGENSKQGGTKWSWKINDAKEIRKNGYLPNLMSTVHEDSEFVSIDHLQWPWFTNKQIKLNEAEERWSCVISLKPINPCMYRLCHVEPNLFQMKVGFNFTWD